MTTDGSFVRRQSKTHNRDCFVRHCLLSAVTMFGGHLSMDSLEQCSGNIKLAKYLETLFWTVLDSPSSAGIPETGQNSFHNISQSASAIMSCDICKKAWGSLP